jgi:type IV fimbrial biogenesis protein FimT
MREYKGYSLLEVMVVLGIMAILAALAVPNMFGWGPKQRLLSAANDIQGAINLARMAAIKENSYAVILFNTPAHGFTVFVDSNNNGLKDAGERTLRAGVFKSDIDMATGFSGSKASFDGRGLLVNSAANITLQHARAGSKTIQVAVTGSSRVL